MNTPPEAISRDPLVGARLDGRYLVLGVLGRGGMGVVYDGVHEQLGRPVAIKVLGAGMADSRVAVQRFLREARTASGLTHGNIVDVSDLGHLADGRPYLVMPKMVGEDLATLLERLGPQPPARTAELLRGVSAALDLIHAKGFVHRDIKLENLMHVVREDGSEAVMVLDFGIVGLVSTKASRLTADGSIFGTPAYLPPEVIEGDTMDRRGDVYALATCAFELMTDRLPYEAQNPVRILPLKMMRDPPTMSELTGFAFPDAIEAVIAKGLARKPDARHQTAGEFIACLTAAVKASGLAPTSVPPSTRDAVPREEASTTGKLMRLPPTSELELDLTASSAPPSASEPAVLDRAGSERPRAGTLDEAPQLRTKRAFTVFAAGAGAGALALVAWASLHGEDAPSKQRAPSNVLPATPSAAARAPETAPAAAIEAVPAVEPAPAPAPLAEPQAVPSPAATAEPVAEPAANGVVAVRERRARTASTKREASPTAATEAPAPPPPPPPAAVTTRAPEPRGFGQSAVDLNKAATQALMQGHVALAAELYSQATRVDPHNAAAFRGVGLASEKLGRKFDAIRAFRRALELSPSGPQAESLRRRLTKLEGQ